MEQRTVGGKLVLAIKVKERPVLERWAVRGVDRVSEGAVKGRVKLVEGRPLDRNAVEQSRASIDSLYKDAGYYAAQVKTLELPQDGGKIRVVFDVNEGSRVAISQVVVEGNKRFDDKTVVKQMATRPEGFWWFQKGEYDEDKLEEDVREKLPRWYADRGFVDFQVTGDSLAADSAGGKATLHLKVEEGQQYSVGAFDIEGNRRFSTEELMAFYPFGPVDRTGAPIGGAKPFSRSEWDAATEKVQNLYANNGYIYAQVDAGGDPAHRPGRQAGHRPRLDHPRGLAGDDQQDRDRRQRRHPRAGDPRGDRHAPGRPVQPGAADPLVPERRPTSASSSSRCRRPT